jgi:hypothetical protein
LIGKKKKLNEIIANLDQRFRKIDKIERVPLASYLRDRKKCSSLFFSNGRIDGRGIFVCQLMMQGTPSFLVAYTLRKILRKGMNGIEMAIISKK